MAYVLIGNYLSTTYIYRNVIPPPHYCELLLITTLPTFSLGDLILIKMQFCRRNLSEILEKGITLVWWNFLLKFFPIKKKIKVFQMVK